VRGHWFKAILTALKVGVCAALLFAVLLAVGEDFNFDVTDRSLSVGAITALITFLVVAIRSTVKRYRY